MEKKNALVSIIVPCYNQAQYLAETLDSVLAQTYPYWECIIVNDGSIDNTEEVANTYCRLDERFIYYHKENGGLADTRNYGIKHSTGYYILPLDSDDKIGATYIEKAVKYLDMNPTTKLVYCEAELFGIKTGKWKLEPYNYENLLRKNHIFCSCIYRRSDYDRTFGYNPNMKYGFEDWDFLLSLLTPEDVVYRIPEILFYYRQKESSMLVTLYSKRKLMISQMILNHPNIYENHIDYLIEYFDGNDYKNAYSQICSSHAYRLGKFILKPFSCLRNVLKCNKR